MKKILVILIALAMIVAGAIIIQQYMIKPTPVETALPTGALGYVRVIDLEKHFQELLDSRLFQSLIQIDFKKVMQTLGSEQKDIDQFEAFKQQLLSPVNQKIIKKFFGKEAALAVYPGILDTGAINPDKAAASIFLVTRLGPEMKLVDFLTGALSQLNKNITVQTRKYKGHDIDVIASNDGSINVAYAHVKDLFIIGLGEETARQGIDVIAGSKGSLTQDSQYLSAKAKAIMGEHLFGYVNFDLVLSAIKDRILGTVIKEMGNSAVIKEKIDESFKNMQGFKTVGFSGAFDGIVQLKMDMFFDPAAMAPDVRALYACPARDNPTLRFVPKNILGYQWTACYDFNYFWRESQKDKARLRQVNPQASESQAQEPQDQISALEEQLGLSIEKDILPVLSDEIGGYLTDIKTGGLFPIPQITFLLKVKDKDKGDQIIQSLFEKQPLFRLETENYKDIPIHYFTIPLAVNQEPCYAFIGDYLLVSINRPAVKEAIDAWNDPSLNVTTQARLKTLKMDFSPKSNSAMFVQMDLLTAKALEVVAWADKSARDQMERQQAFIKGSQQRLKDIQQDKQAWQKDIEAMEGDLSSLVAKTGNLGQGMDPVKKIEEDMDRTDKFIQQIKENLSVDKKDEQDLLKIKNTPNLALPPEGEKQLMEIQGEIAKKQKKLEDLNKELQGLKDRKESVNAALAGTQNLQKSLDEKKQGIKTAEATEKELNQTIAGFSSKAVDQEKQKVLIEDFLKPLITSLTHVKAFALKSMLEQGTLETVVHVQGE